MWKDGQTSETKNRKQKKKKKSIKGTRDFGQVADQEVIK